MSLLKTPSRAEPARRRKSKVAPGEEDWSGTPVRGILPLVLALIIWQLVGNKDSPYFPPPSEWYEALKPLVTQDVLLPAIRATTITFVVGLALATLIGAVVGAIVGSNRLVDRALGPTLEFLRILPAASLVPIAALILGYTTQMKLVVVVLPALWPILLACRSARRSLNPVLLDVPRTLGLSRMEGLLKVTVPSMLRPVLLGVRVAAPLALIITVLVEIVTRVNGLGALLGAAQSNYASAQVYGLLSIAGVLGFVVNWVVTRLDHAVSRRMGV
jgi:ABC-type nitrate/sulfonate/bicarbonate transport system permease component